MSCSTEAGRDVEGIRQCRELVTVVPVAVAHERCGVVDSRWVHWHM